MASSILYLTGLWLTGLSWFLCSKSNKAKIKLTTGLGFLLEIEEGCISQFIQVVDWIFFFFFGSYQIKVPVVLPAVRSDQFLILSLWAPPATKTWVIAVLSIPLPYSWATSLQVQVKMCLSFKSSWDCSAPTQVIYNNLTILRSVNVKYIWEILLSCHITHS